ncbi:MAG: hypothetical protein ABIU58_05970 [Ramlibacter sp.]
MIAIWKFPRKLLVIAVIGLVVACSWIPSIQALAAEQTDAGLKRALVTFASARAFNALISVLQGTEVVLHPLGFGVTLAPGQVLDPINDLVEQFATLMLVASVAFGIQKALLAIGSHWVVSVAVTAFALAWAVLYFQDRATARVARVLAVLLMIRFAIPVVTIGGDFLFRHFLAQDYVTSQQSIDEASREVEKQAAQTPAAEAPQGLFDRFKAGVTAPVTDLKLRYESIKATVEKLPERLVKMIVVFLLQTLVIPLLLLWLLYSLLMGLVWTRGTRTDVSPLSEGSRSP